MANRQGRPLRAKLKAMEPSIPGLHLSLRRQSSVQGPLLVATQGWVPISVCSCACLEVFCSRLPPRWVWHNAGGPNFGRVTYVSRVGYASLVGKVYGEHGPVMGYREHANRSRAVQWRVTAPMFWASKVKTAISIPRLLGGSYSILRGL